MSKHVAEIPPALDGRRTYNDQVSAALSSRFLFATCALFALLVALGAVGGLVHLSQQSKFVPYVIERGCGGQIVPAGAARPADALDPKIIELWEQGAIANFITNARLVTSDAQHQLLAATRVFAFLSPGDPARDRMQKWYLDDEPRERSARELVAVEISSVLAQSPQTWQVDWVENVSDVDGSLKSRYRMRALLQVYRRASTRETAEADLRENPLGLFVRDFSWSRQL